MLQMSKAGNRALVSALQYEGQETEFLSSKLYDVTFQIAVISTGISQLLVCREDCRYNEIEQATFEWYYLLRCDAVCYGKSLPIIRRYVLLPSSGSESKASKQETSRVKF
jgi:hypothetical protein